MPTPCVPSRLPDGRTPVLLSSHHQELLAQDATAILGYLDRRPPLPASAAVAAVASQVLRTRRIRRHRAVLRAGDLDELADGLRALAGDLDHPLLARSSAAAAERRAFVFPGQGNQWPSMGADAYGHLPVYRAQADECAHAFAAAGAPSPVAYLIATSEPAGNTAPDSSSWTQVQRQAAQFTHAVALARVWQSCGIVPDLTVGHSLGEVAAAYIAGTIALSDAAGIITARSAVIDDLGGDFGMAMLGVTVAEARDVIANIPGWLEVSVVNADSSVVVSGDRAAAAEAVAVLAARGAFVRELAVDFPAHTTALEPLRDDLTARLPPSTFTDSPVEFVGSAHGAVVPADTDFARYWYENLRNTVRFDLAVHTARARGAGVFVELSAHPTLLVALDGLAGDEALAIGSSRRDQPLREHLTASILTAAVGDPGFRWSDLITPGVEPDSGSEPVAAPLRGFPNAPMRATHLWATRQPQEGGSRDPEPPLTISHESWRPTTRSRSTTEGGPGSRLAIVAAPGADAGLVARLADALERHPHACSAHPDDADAVAVVAPAVTAHDEIGGLVGAGLLGYARGTSRLLWLVTAGAEQAADNDPAPMPAQAALAAMHRSFGFEYPERTFAHLDLPAFDVGRDTAAAALDALLSDDVEVALRGTRLFVRTLTDADAGPPPAFPPGAFDSVVITGGTGGLGLQFAQACADRGAREIVLLSRGGTDAATLRRLGARGTRVSAPRCDVTDIAALAAVAGQASAATLLIHAAGSAVFAPADRLTADALRDTFAAKVNGLDAMVEHWPLGPGCRLLLCSSVSAVWGGYGHAGYAAANRLLDATAARLRADGRDCVSVRSGLWPGAGMLDEHERARTERAGLLPMPAAAALDACLRDHRGDPMIFAANHDRLRVLLGDHRSAPQLNGATPRALTADVVRAELAAALSVGAAGVELDTALIDLGLDSLLALDLRQRLRRVTGRSVPLATLLGGITAAELLATLNKTEEHSRD